jgi:hypothetical protein
MEEISERVELPRDHWTFGLWFFLIFLNASFALALWGAFDLRTALLDFFICLGFTLWIAEISPLRIVTDGEWIYVGKAKIEKRFIASVEVLNNQQMAAKRTRDANPMAYLALRFWVKEGAVIHLSDSRDVTPYWLVSYSDPELIRNLCRLP